MSNKELVDSLVRTGRLKTPAVIRAFYEVDRRDFMRQDNYSDIENYGDYPLPIGLGQTISQPSTVAFMLELLQPKEGDKILDLGSGSGWTTGLLADIVGEKGFVYGVEIIPELVEFGKENLQKYFFTNAEILPARNSIIGLQAEAPFDKILVSAAGNRAPSELIAQLRVGGRMVLPVKNAILKIDKIDGQKTKEEKFEGFVFVPLRTIKA